MTIATKTVSGGSAMVSAVSGPRNDYTAVQRNAQTLVEYGPAMQAITHLLPKLTMSEWEFVKNLPREFRLDVPYVQQEQPHWCGAACAQMILGFHGLPAPSQQEIARACGWDDVNEIRYESFSEGLAQHLLSTA